MNDKPMSSAETQASANAGAGVPSAEKAFQNVQVAVRCRPLNNKERQNNDTQVTKFEKKNAAIEVDHPKIPQNRRYAFDRVFNQDTTQGYLFDSCVVPIIDEVLQGYSCTVFAYGQTGTGKTYTMEGDYSRSTSESMSENAGIIPRAVNRIFNYLRNEHSDSDEYSVRMSFLELYNEQLTDLLSADEDDLPIDAEWYAKGGKQYDVRKMAKAGIKPQAKSKLHIVDDGRRGVTVQNLEEMLVHSEEEVFSHVKKGFEKRQVAQTKCNDFSSRSHAIFTLTIHSKETTEDGEEIMKVGKLNLVDLAGSECIGRSGAKGKQRQEASVINRSLLTLGRVISALVEKQPHVPYRDSKLTRLLQDSLGGHTKTCIIATMSPASSCVEETLSTLDYAWRAKQIKNIPTANAKMTKHKMLKEFTSEIDQLQRMLQASREKDGVYLPQDMYDELTAAKKAAELRVTELEDLKMAQTEEIEELRQSLKDFEEKLEESREAHHKTKNQLHQATSVLNETTENLLNRRAECEEKGVLLFAHRESEKMLHSQARDLVNELKGSVSDVRGLHSKAERQQRSEQENYSKVEKYRDNCRSRLSSLVDRTNQFTSGQRKGFDFLLQNLDQQAESQSSQMKTLKQSLETTQQAFKDGLNSVEEKLQKQQKQAQQEQESLRYTSSKTSQGFSDELASLQEQVQSQINQIKEVLESERSGQQQALQRSKDVLKQMDNSMSSFLEQYHSDLSKLQEASDAGFDTAIQTLVSQRIQLQAFEKSRKSSLEKAGQELISAVQNSVQKMIEEQSESTSEAVNNLNEKGNSAISNLEKTKTDVNEKAENSKSGVDEWIRQQQEDISKESGAREQDMETLKGCEASVSKASNDISALAVDSVTKIGEQNTNWLNTIESSINRLGDTWKTTTSEVKRLQEGSESEVSKCFSDLHQKIDSSSEQIKSNVKENKSALAESKHEASNLGEFVSEWKEAENGHISTLVDEEIALCPATGTTPAKRTYNVPEQLVCTSPHESIMERFRSHKSQRTSSSSDATSSNAARVTESGELQIPDISSLENPANVEHAYTVNAPAEVAKGIAYGDSGRPKPSLVPISPSQTRVSTPKALRHKDDTAQAISFEGAKDQSAEQSNDEWFGNSHEQQSPKEQEGEQEGSSNKSEENTPPESRSSVSSSESRSSETNVHRGPPTTSSRAPKVSNQQKRLVRTASSSSMSTTGSKENDNESVDDGDTQNRRGTTGSTSSSRIPALSKTSRSKSRGGSSSLRRQTRATAKRTGLSDASNTQE
eukprot:gb/GECG01008799.1/.p1 GENE.gb/GECG01008799.1/~~gb/GECG01008799.1/.p1  ORF type:complete len:1278 (+),score=260.28 gb/GECG01008799.1/:1-3834(+)